MSWFSSRAVSTLRLGSDVSPAFRLAHGSSAVTLGSVRPSTDTCTPCLLAFSRVQLAPPVLDRTLHLASSNLTPNALLTLEIIKPFRIALPESCLLMMAPFFMFAVASWASLIFFAMIACCRAALIS